MKSKLLLICLLLVSSYGMAQFTLPGGGGPGGPPAYAPIDTNEIVLIIAAVLLTVGAVVYRKLSLKKA